MTDAIRKILDAQRHYHSGGVYEQYHGPEVEAARAELTALEGEAELHARLSEMRHQRVLIADKAWQAAHDKPDTLPDLGDLIDWLMGRIAALEVENAGLREVLWTVDAWMLAEDIVAQLGSMDAVTDYDRIVEQIRAALAPQSETTIAPSGKRDEIADQESLRMEAERYEASFAILEARSACASCGMVAVPKDMLRKIDFCLSRCPFCRAAPTLPGDPWEHADDCEFAKLIGEEDGGRDPQKRYGFLTEDEASIEVQHQERKATMRLEHGATED